MSNAVSARIDQLNIPLLRSSEKHGRRLDKTSQARKVRDDASLAWSPHDGDPLALVDRLADHVTGALVPKGKTNALHMIVKLPDSVPVATTAQAALAMSLAIEFAQETFGGNAVFAARIDRDERTLNNVDLFLAPRYEKVTTRTSKPAIAMTRHLKLLAEKHGREAEGGGARGGMIAQGRALQDELAAWLTARGFEAVRGEAKATRGSDHLTPEEIGAKHDREAAEAALREAERGRAETEARNRQLDDREWTLRGQEAVLKRETVRLAAKAVAVDKDRAAAGEAFEQARQRGVALDRREVSIGEREKGVDRQAVLLGGLIKRLEPLLAILQRAHDHLATAPEQVRRWLDPDRQVGAAIRTARPLVEQARDAARRISRGPGSPPEQEPVDLAAQKAALDARTGRNGK